MEQIFLIIIACSPASGFQLVVNNCIEDSINYKSTFFYDDLEEQIKMIAASYSSCKDIHLYGPKPFCERIKDNIIKIKEDYNVEIN